MVARLRSSSSLRHLLAETQLEVSDLIYPIFVHHQADHHEPIPSMPGQYQWGLNTLDRMIDACVQAGIQSVLLFGLPACKDAKGSASWDQSGPVQQAIKRFKQKAPHILVIVDLCFCQYTDHGHCGVLNHHGTLNHQETLKLLSKQMMSLVEAGADVIAPSGMIDKTVATLRQTLDQAGYPMLPIMNYTVKYCSHFYGPFRDAADGAPSSGDRSTHQMDFRQRSEAFSEIEQDLEEGVDMAIIKPAGAYLDVIARIHDRYPQLPLVGYQVSGEYASLCAAIEKGWLGPSVIEESLLAIKRAGATAIITYFALDYARQLRENV